MEKTMMEEDTFTCAVCNRTFIKGRSEEEALAEKNELFPDASLKDCELVCDDCFIAMGSGKIPDPTPYQIREFHNFLKRLFNT